MSVSSVMTRRPAEPLAGWTVVELQTDEVLLAVRRPARPVVIERTASTVRQSDDVVAGRRCRGRLSRYNAGGGHTTCVELHRTEGTFGRDPTDRHALEDSHAGSSRVVDQQCIQTQPADSVRRHGERSPKIGPARRREASVRDACRLQCVQLLEAADLLQHGGYFAGEELAA